MLYNAHRGGVPLVITAGQQHTGLLQYDPHLSGDLVGMGKQYSKWSTELSYATDIPTVIQRAFKMAMQPPTGPVFVSIPQDVLEQPLDFEYVPNTPVHTRLRPDREALKEALTDLFDALKKDMSPQDTERAKARVKRIAEEKAKMDELFMAQVVRERDNVPISVSRLMQELKGAIKPDTIFVSLLNRWAFLVKNAKGRRIWVGLSDPQWNQINRG